MRLVPRRFALCLLGLRVGVVAALFLTITLDPILARSVKEEVPGRVLIAVDRSDSMKITDPNRPLAEKLRLGKLLKLTTDLASEGQHDSWIRQAEADGSVRFGLLGGGEERDRYEKVVKRLNKYPRLTIAARVLTPDGLRLVDALRAKHAVEIVGVGETGPRRGCGEATRSGGGGRSTRRKARGPDLHGHEAATARAAESAGDAPDAAGPKLFGGDAHRRPAQLGRIPGDRGGTRPRKVPVFPWSSPRTSRRRTLPSSRHRPSRRRCSRGAGTRRSRGPGHRLAGRADHGDADTPPDGRRSRTETIDHDGRDATYPLTFKATLDPPARTRSR